MILDGTLLRIDRIGMTGGRDRPYYSGKHEVHGLNAQTLADPAARLIWISAPLARHSARHGAARKHGIIDALDTAEISTSADTACKVMAHQYGCRRLDPDSGRDLPLSRVPEDSHRTRPPAQAG